MNIFKRLIYFFLSIREKSLLIRLDKHFKKSSSNMTTKTVVDGSTTMTLSAETDKNAALVRKNIEDILKANGSNPYRLLEYIKSSGTPVYKLDNADKILAFIHEGEGFITEQRGFAGLYMNIVTGGGMSMTSRPMFVMREGEINPYYMIHQFYKWYSLKSQLPGFDYASQQLFKKYMGAKTQSDLSDMSTLDLESMLGLKEAIARDREASEFAYNTACEEEGGKQAFDKLTGGGASI